MEPSKTGVLQNMSVVFTSWSKFPLNKPSTVISTHPSGHASFRNDRSTISGLSRIQEFQQGLGTKDRF